jgi:hypothetical protein
MPSVNATYVLDRDAVNQRIPDIPFYVQYGWKEGKGWLRLSGILRNMGYYNNISRSRENEMGLGIKLSGASPFGSRFTLYSQTVFGKGIASYVQDLQGLGMDMVPLRDGSGEMEGVEVVASYLGLQYLISNKLSASATFSEVKCFFPDKAEPMPEGTYRNASYFVTNLIYKVSPVLTTGVEYLWGSRRNTDETYSHNNRVQMSLRVNF